MKLPLVITSSKLFLLLKAQFASQALLMKLEKHWPQLQNR
jgi:hypothetical protein